MNFFLSCVHELSKSMPSSSGECDYNACMRNFSVQLANSIFDVLVIFFFFFFGGGGLGVGLEGIKNRNPKTRVEFNNSVKYYSRLS